MSEQSVRPSANVPAGHASHWLALPSENVPGSQTWQSPFSF